MSELKVIVVLLRINRFLDLTVIDLLLTFQEFGVTFTYGAVHMRRLISYSSPEGELRGRNGTGFKATLRCYILCHRLATMIGGKTVSSRE